MGIISRKRPTERPVVGLVLGGGGARGFVQVGALKAFKECGIDFDICVGTSVGSIIGALYCAGIEPDEIMRAAESLEFGDLHGKILFKPDNPRKIGDALYRIIGDAQIENLHIKYAAVATDLKTGKQVIMNSGSVLDAVSASSAFPIAYAPLQKDGMNLSDGGLVNNIPADVCRMLGAKKTVTVDAHGSRGSGTDGTGIFDMLKAMFSIMSANASVVGLMHSDVVIAPDTSAFKSTSKSGYMEMYELGYRAALEKCDEIKALFEPLPANN
ncbi:MAG: patatin-like phospholipase family protein [Clostridiales bacterium]|nr:patatin-like phospholipase family protein [Clostridiales bacterium]